MDKFEPNDWYKRMAETWDLVTAVGGGTPTMRRAGTKYLPQEPLELQVQYDQRLQRSFFVNYYGDAVEKIVSRPFSKPTQWEGGVNTVKFCENPTGDAKDMTQFMRSWDRKATMFGVAHVLLDMPAEPAITLADLRLPTARVLPPTAVPTWTYEGEGRDRVLTSVSILETDWVADGYRMKPVEQVRVFTRDSWEVWRKVEDEWVMANSGVHTFGEVPLVTLNLTGEGFEARPPLEDLAWLNVAHWQTTSDQRNAMRFARIGMLFVSGVKKKEVLDMMAVGPSRLNWTENENADAKYVEHSGAAMKIGADDIAHLEQQMEQLGAQPLIERTASSTATGKMIDEGRSVTVAQAWAGLAQDAGERLLELVSRVLQEDPAEAKLTMYVDFDSSVSGDLDKDRLMKLRAMGDIDRLTHLELQQRRGLLPDDLDVKKVADAAGKEDNAFGQSNDPGLSGGSSDSLGANG